MKKAYLKPDQESLSKSGLASFKDHIASLVKFHEAEIAKLNLMIAIEESKNLSVE